MVSAAIAPHFWAAVEDCLVTFHHLPRCQAAEKVTGLWRRLPAEIGDDVTFAEMIYHADPWQIACNLAEQDLPVTSNRCAYQMLLARNGLSPAPEADSLIS